MRGPRGFTLVELMVTIAVLAIVLSVAAPSFLGLIQGNRTQTLSQDLLGAVQLARAEAVKRRQTVLVCRRNDAGTDCAEGTDWTAGWLVRESGGDVLRVWDPVSGMVVTSPQASVGFRSTGIAGAATNLSVTPSSGSGGRVGQISVSATGNTTFSMANCP